MALARDGKAKTTTETTALRGTCDDRWNLRDGERPLLIGKKQQNKWFHNIASTSHP